MPEITSIKFHSPKREGAIVKFVSVCFDNVLIIRGLRIVKTTSGELFVSFPNRKTTSGNRVYSSYPIDEDFRVYVQETVLSEYEKQPEAPDVAEE